ncbi:MAG: transferrin-binding protein-like solute binding protein [Rhodospirillales bacterium]|nr:transferrin-binding protein-like solute binding protein [Rhodospirillales bacterium]MDE0380251.1 transferrin-binding protein-like solute binding protein [Rhodospirillales bacterium]
MRTGLTIAALPVVIALAACTHSSDPPPPPPPTADEAARASHAHIVSGANTLLRGDRLGYDASDDEVERVNTTCEEDRCAIGFLSVSKASNFGVDGWELELLRERRGVILVRQDVSGTYGDAEAFGGWLEHSLFATQTSLFTNDDDPDHGATIVSNYSLGFSRGENPSAAQGSARWEGLMLGRDVRAAPSRGQVIRGDADVTVDFAADSLTADVAFTGVVNIETGDLHDDMAWHGMTVEDGGFARTDAPDDTISGRFYGPGEEEVGGVFEQGGIAGAFGGRRTSAP